MNVLMVCLGNICRSPMAEGIFRAQAEERNIPFHVDSCGTANYHVGESPDIRSIKKAAEHHVDISTLSGRQFAPHDFDRFDLILTMDQSNFRNVIQKARQPSDRDKVKLILDYVSPNESQEVPDPWYGDEEDFETVYQLLNQAANKFFKHHFNA